MRPPHPLPSLLSLTNSFCLPRPSITSSSSLSCNPSPFFSLSHSLRLTKLKSGLPTVLRLSSGVYCLSESMFWREPRVALCCDTDSQSSHWAFGAFNFSLHLKDSSCHSEQLTAQLVEHKDGKIRKLLTAKWEVCESSGRFKYRPTGYSIHPSLLKTLTTHSISYSVVVAASSLCILRLPFKTVSNSKKKKILPEIQPARQVLGLHCFVRLLIQKHKQPLSVADILSHLWSTHKGSYLCFCSCTRSTLLLQVVAQKLRGYVQKRSMKLGFSTYFAWL